MRHYYIVLLSLLLSIFFSGTLRRIKSFQKANTPTRIDNESTMSTGTGVKVESVV